MRATAYLDQSVLGNLDHQSVLQSFTELRQRGLVPVVSHHHLTEICLGSAPERYIERLRNLNPLFLSLEKSATMRGAGNVELSEIDPAFEIEWHRDHVGSLEETYLRSLFPLLKMTGGLVDTDAAEILDDYIVSMKTVVSAVFVDSSFLVRTLGGLLLRNKLLRAEREIRQSFASIDFATEAQKVGEVRQRVIDLGNITQIPAEQVIDAVLDQFDPADRRVFQEQFPRGFAKGKSDRASDLTAFAFTMFTFGAVSGSGKALRTKMETKKQPYRAQFMDCLHIGEASFFDAFITCDEGAHRLAAAVYSYAGLSTCAIKLALNSAS